MNTCQARDGGHVHGCGIPDGELCVTHRQEAGRILVQVPLVLAWLGDIPAGLTRAATSRSGHTGARVPYSDDASAATADYLARIGFVVHATGRTAVEAAAKAAAGQWRHFDGALRLHALRDAERAAETILQPPGRWYAGTCSEPLNPPGTHCTAELYARTGRGHVTCPTCHARHDLAQRRAYLLTQAADYHVTAAEAARIAPALLGDHVTPATIRKWGQRGRIPIVGTLTVPTLRGLRTANLYRLGDITAAATRAARTGCAA